jgi:methylenetetrahydrofolate dehydrogenase (NADP+) / methenyltetrahydrofolate cyclohydrolase
LSARILDGKLVASRVKAEVAAAVGGLDYIPGLATVLVGDDPASQSYVRGKRRDAAEVGIQSFHHELAADTVQVTLDDLVDSLNDDDSVDGILVQLPLPDGLNSEATVERIDPAKDVDGLHPFNLGLLALSRPGLRPCTPSGILRVMEEYNITTSGATAVVVGRSFLVGRPLALMLSEKGVDATVTVTHSRTKDLVALTKEADLLIAAVGSPGIITGDGVKPGATVIDVGINRTDDGLVGDVDFESVVEIAGAITPVPGGIGPMTRAMLLSNTLAAAEARRG